MRRARGRDISGWMVVDKPAGMSSARVCALVRRALDARRAGHAGTLDPMATGVLPVALGEATKTVAFVQRAPKVYEFVVRWGATTRSHDSDGEVLAQDGRAPRVGDVRAALGDFLGDTMQRPPRVSAVKIDGKRSYARVRDDADAAPAPEPRAVWCGEMTLLADGDDADGAQNAANPPTARFRAQVGKGFYVRAFVRDLARGLGVFGHIERLRRIRVGAFSLDAAVKIKEDGGLAHDDLERALAPLDAALAAATTTSLDDVEASRLRCGQATFARAPLEPGRPWSNLFPMHDDRRDDDAPIVARDGAGRPVALARLDGDALKPVRVFGAPLATARAR